jgi:hypothetical protein
MEKIKTETQAEDCKAYQPQTNVVGEFHGKEGMQT